MREITKEQIEDVAFHLGAAKFWIWAVEEGLKPVIENYDEVFSLSRDKATISVKGLTLQFEEGILKEK